MLCAVMLCNYTLPMADQALEQEQQQSGDLEVWMISSDAQQQQVHYENKYMRLIRKLQDQIDKIKEENDWIINNIKQQRREDQSADVILVGLFGGGILAVAFILIALANQH